MKWTLSLVMSAFWIVSASPSSYSQEKPSVVVTDAQWTTLNKALLIADRLVKDLEDAERKFVLFEESLVRAEALARAQNNLWRVALEERLLPALLSLAEHRTKKRPTVVKILTFGIMRDKKDALLEGEIKSLQRELMDWKF